MTNRKDLKFNQQCCDLNKFNELVAEDAMGTKYQEGFTSFSIKEGKVLLSGRELNEREKTKGTTVPKVELSQIEEMIKLAEEFKEIQREIFLLITNTNSSIIYNGTENIKIIGYYSNDKFIFAGQDDQLALRNDVSSMVLAREIFERDGIVVMPSEEGQPITVVSTDSPYTYITNAFEKAREEISNIITDSEDNKFKITDKQAFLWIIASDIPEAEGILSRLSNEIKRQEYQKIKENFYYLYTIISPEVLEGNEKIFLSYNKNIELSELLFLKEKEDLPKTWRSVFATLRNRYKTTQDLDVFKKLVKEPISKKVNMLAKLCKLCVKFDPKKHNLGEGFGFA